MARACTYLLLDSKDVWTATALPVYQILRYIKPITLVDIGSEASTHHLLVPSGAPIVR